MGKKWEQDVIVSSCSLLFGNWELVINMQESHNFVILVIT